LQQVLLSPLIIHCYVPGSIPTITPRYCTNKIEKCSLEHKQTKEKKIYCCVRMLLDKRCWCTVDLCSARPCVGSCEVESCAPPPPKPLTPPPHPSHCKLSLLPALLRDGHGWSTPRRVAHRQIRDQGMSDDVSVYCHLFPC
jgi:hypothetical protein